MFPFDVNLSVCDIDIWLALFKTWENMSYEKNYTD